MKQLKSVIISRTDSIGDVVLTLPMCRLLKQHFPEIKISFLAREYTRAVIEACPDVDEFLLLDDFLQKTPEAGNTMPEAIIHVFPVAAIARRAKELGIRTRIGTTNRLFHWTTCNRMVPLSRKNSDLHEAQLNIKLLSPLGINTDVSLAEISRFPLLSRIRPLPEAFLKYLSPDRYNLLLHPKSQGSAREWGLNNFTELVRLLDKEKFNILISGTAKERALLDELFENIGNAATDITGLMNLHEFLSFIAHCDGLVANSTGPLHMAAAVGIDAFGIFPPIRPMHPGRWAPLGIRTEVFVLNKNCSDCRKNPRQCHCIKEVLPVIVKEGIEKRLR